MMASISEQSTQTVYKSIMMQLPIYHVDAFVTDKPFSGNPAAVCPLADWLSVDLMLQIATQNNLSETAFFVPTETEGTFDLKWFTPAEEVDLCGHATMAAAYVVFAHLFTLLDSVTFRTNSGNLMVSRDELFFVMDFPAMPSKRIEVSSLMHDAIGIQPIEAYDGQDLILVLSNQDDVIHARLNATITPLLNLNRGIVITAPGEDTDFVSRYFAPELAVNEDPVTGSAHCQLAPLWSNKLNKTSFKAAQLSQRMGWLNIELHNDRVQLKGQAKQYLRGTIDIC